MMQFEQTTACDRKSKYISLRNYLKDYIASNPPGTQLPSYPRMIREYGISQATIDKALQTFDQDGTIDRINGRGIFISEKATQKNVGLIFGRNLLVPGISPVLQFFLKFAEDHAVEYNDNVSYFINTRQVLVESHGLMVNRDLQDALNAGRLHGLILMAPRGPEEINWLSGYDLPMVAVTPHPGKAYGVTMDLAGIVRLGVEALIEAGCSRIALLSMYGHMRKDGVTDDVDAYHQCLKQHQLEQRSEWIWDQAEKPPEHTPELTLSNAAQGKRAAKSLLGHNPKRGRLPVDGVISTDDMATVGFLEHLRKHGIVPGTDIIMATHANRGVSSFGEADSRLIKIEVDPSEIAQVTFSSLKQLMDGKLTAPGLHVVRPHLKTSGHAI